jgi:hypothetical protein
MLNPNSGQIMEFSSAQNVDFGPSADRAQGDTQLIDQDVRMGINGAQQAKSR